MNEQQLNYLEKVFVEYIEYKNYLKSIIKPVPELLKEVAEKINDKTTEEQATEIYMDVIGVQKLHQEDFFNQQQRLFYTVEAYKDIMEIPQEIKTEIENLKFLQCFAVKNNKTEIVDQQAIDFTKEQIRNEMSVGVEKFKKAYL